MRSLPAGPIIRLNSNELHIQDTDFYNVYYRQGNKLDKYSPQTEMFGIPATHFTTGPHDLHRLRRAPLAPSFSKKSVFDISGMLQEKIDVLCARIRGCQAQHEPVPLGLGYVALTVDIISSYALGDCFQLLKRKDFGVEYHHSIIGLVQSNHFIKHFPWIYEIMRKLPNSFVARMEPEMKPTLEILEVRSDTDR